MELQIRMPYDLLYELIREEVQPEMRKEPHWVSAELYCYCIS